MTLVQSIKNEARRLGFTLAGITTPDPPPHLSTFENWLKLGRQASMAYLADEHSRLRRADPRRILPECKSILMLGIRYPDPKALPPTEAGRGRLAAYAWGKDYHLVLPERLEALAEFIQAQVGYAVAHRSYTDTGPILERDLAQRAGLGWIGKNTCLIHPRLGSYFLLAELLLALELEPDPPFETDHCGTCTRCLDACPTACILPDRTLEAGRCISYLTIENKGDIPVDLREQMGEWVFGCDICQQVCPWNKFSDEAYEAEFAPRPGVPAPELAAEQVLTATEFNRKFKDSPVQRARRRGYLRNVAVAQGNAGGSKAATSLETAAQDDEALVRDHAAWALEQIRSR